MVPAETRHVAPYDPGVARPDGLRLLRLANPAVRLVLRSPLHGVLGTGLALLAYRGRRTGRRLVIPVLVAPWRDGLVALAARPERKQWWRTFRRDAPAELRLAGRVLPVQGRLLDGAEAGEARRAYLERFPRAGRTLARTQPALVAFTPRAEA